jgi:hypothetical protein
MLLENIKNLELRNKKISNYLNIIQPLLPQKIEE